MSSALVASTRKYLAARPSSPEPPEPTNVALSNGFIVINSGGGPTDDKPTVTLQTPRDPDRVSSFLNIRVKDIEAVYAEWSSQGREFPDTAETSPVRDPLLHPRSRRSSDRSGANHGSRWRLDARSLAIEHTRRGVSLNAEITARALKSTVASPADTEIPTSWSLNRWTSWTSAACGRHNRFHGTATRIATTALATLGSQSAPRRERLNLVPASTALQAARSLWQGCREVWDQRQPSAGATWVRMFSMM